MSTTTAENGRLDKLEDHAVRTEDRLNVIERTQGVHGDKLDQIVTAVTRYDSRPIFDMHKAVSMVRDIFAICAVLATLAVWLVVILTTANDRVTALELKHQTERVDDIRQSLGLFKSGTWTPQIEKRGQ